MADNTWARWTVETSPSYRVYGPLLDVGAFNMRVEHGTLLFADAQENLVHVMAPGTWLTVVREEE